MPSLDDEEPFECMVLQSNDKRMSEDSSSPTVVLRPKSKECDANASKQKSKEDCDGKEKEDTNSEKDPLQREVEGNNSTGRGYFAETVDFPDSPLHLKLLKKRNREAQGLDTEDDEEESTTISIMGHHSSHRPRRERPKSLNTSKNLDSRRKITVNPDILTSDIKDDDQKSIDSLSYRSLTALDDLATPDDIDTPDDLDDDLFDNTLADDLEADEGPFIGCVVGGEERRIDLKVIEPYKKVLSHGGYIGSPNLVIIVFSACYLPDRARFDYDYVMDNLFLYVLTTLAQLVAQDYVLIYLHGATSRSCMPSFGWLKRCYQMIDRRLRKNLKGLYLVHPTFWLKTIVIMTKPFISSKFSRKLRFVNNLQELEELIPMDHVCIPDKVKAYDEKRMMMSSA